jgi:hypothetical protein
MKPTSLALAATLALAAGGIAPASAQTRDQTGAATQAHRVPGGDGGASATTGAGTSDERSLRGDEDDASAPERNARRHWSDRGPMAMPMRPPWPHRRMMMMGGGAQFHFARGKARIDVTCSPQEDTQACARAAGDLIDKIAALQRARGDTTMGSGGRGDAGPDAAAPSDDDQDAAGERM